MAVTSKDISPNAGKRSMSGGRANRYIALAGWLGLWLGLASFGGVVWAINGGYSVLGLQVIAQAFNDAGRIFWAFASRWTFTISIDLPGISAHQPVIPWCGVVAASLLQVSVLLLRLLKLPVPTELVVAAALFSLYDFATTFFGLGKAPWLQGGGVIIQGLIALVLTFALEFVIALLLQRVVRAVVRRHE